ncbi:hypothetical protein D9758_008650 [Tetrapyrgos nigripes]|uniref:Dye-decolorizing peroxidase n=1 Tax=Tetrapyrgos nigripes TaxID=182062 RepID=A0A8H5D5V7_9AGAR|nr:hypothetical protein D9758_008650 [Tetrapyrgos nigripes]
MKVSYIAIVIGLAVQSALAVPKFQPRRTSILINPDAQPDLPSPQNARLAGVTPANAGLNLNDIQGDILIGMKKKKELFFFFSIDDAATFKSKLSSDIKSLITNTNQLLSVSTQPITAVNIAFSQAGLTALGVSDNLGDNGFKNGQFADAANLGDAGTTNWVSGFAGTKIHGVFLLASDTVDNVDNELANLQNILGSSISEIHRVAGAARPGNQEGHEHFGFMDGISQPAVQGFTQNVLNGQATVAPGELLVGETGDSLQSSRPSWTTGGSFLVFRQLQQMVPEFNKYVANHALSVPGLTAQENEDLFGARLIGRWKSGAPIDLAPLRDDVDLANDNTRNNNFTFNHPEVPGFVFASNQTDCPFSAHIRKTRPRADLGSENTGHHIMRAGIPYGPEVTDAEASAQQSSTDPTLERGLAFVAYQSNIANGFEFMQEAWVNNANFIFGKSTPPGVDPIIGRVAGSAAETPRDISGTDPLTPTKKFSLDVEFVVSRGGEYFFSPPISALSGVLSA